MRPVVRNILAVVAGFALGSLVNMALILVSGKVIPPPAGADLTTMEGLRSSMRLLEPKHFLFPFLAHALGTLSGAFAAAALAASRKTALALLIGLLFLAGGAMSVSMLPAPMWFNIVDLAGAYLPMAWIGARLAARKS